MPGEIPPFLRDFIAMRKNLHKAPEPNAPVGSLPRKGAKKGGTTEATQQELSEISVAKIVEEKPPAKELGKYFQSMCDRLTKQKMAA